MLFEAASNALSASHYFFFWRTLVCVVWFSVVCLSMLLSVVQLILRWRMKFCLRFVSLEWSLTLSIASIIVQKKNTFDLYFVNSTVLSMYIWFSLWTSISRSCSSRDYHLPPLNFCSPLTFYVVPFVSWGQWITRFWETENARSENTIRYVYAEKVTKA